MKSILASLCLTLVVALTNAQSNAVLFTENGEKFTVILNGLRQNDQPETNVRITSLNAEFYKLKVIFENTALGEKNFNLTLEPGMESTYVVKKNNKGEYVLRFMGSVAVADAPRAVVAPAPVAPAPTPAPAPAPVAVSGGTVTQTVSTTRTTTTSGTPQDGSVSINMGINVDGMGGNLNLNVSGVDAELEESSSTTTVTHTQTITTSTTGVSAAPAPVAPPPPAPIVYLPGYNGPVGCPVPMSPNDFNDLEASIAAKTFEDTKLTIARQVLRDRCLFVSQVRSIMRQFTFEQNRLEFAKYAYDYTYDIGNYFKVNDQFTFESSTEELDEYIRSRR
jgi:hypothetical protein